MKRAGGKAIHVWRGGVLGLSELIRERVPDDVERANLLDDAVRDLENPSHHLYALTYGIDLCSNGRHCVIGRKPDIHVDIAKGRN
jgi:hypothetical protein